jgi:hypothetical protein
LTVGAKRGRRSGKDLLIMVDRPLTVEDLAGLGGPSSPTAPTQLSKIRSAHHQVAQLMATGFPQVEIGRITGYSQSRLSILKTDPAFSELVRHYQDVKEFKFADAQERMAALGLSTLEELQDRLEASPEDFSTQTLLEMTELLLVKSKASGKGVASLAMSPSQVINVQFVSSGGKVIDAVAEGTDGSTRLISDNHRA